MKVKKWVENEGLEIIESWARDGLTNGEIAQNIGIAPETLSRWLKNYPQIAEAIYNGQFGATIKVENSLFKRTQGYDVEEFEMDSNGNKRGRRRHIPADTTACIFWLKKKKPKIWGDKSEINEDTKEKLNAVLKEIKSNF